MAYAGGVDMPLAGAVGMSVADYYTAYLLRGIKTHSHAMIAVGVFGCLVVLSLTVFILSNASRAKFTVPLQSIKAIKASFLFLTRNSLAHNCMYNSVQTIAIAQNHTYHYVQTTVN
jgi:hypothetical protein